MNYRVVWLLIVLGLFSGRGLSAAQETAVDPRIHRVETGLLPIATSKDKKGVFASIGERMQEFGTPGLSVAVIDGGHLAWAKGYGIADTKTHALVTTDTLFQAASISKPLTALGALVLVQQGKIRLDDDVNRYLKSWKIPDNQFTRAHQVTLRLLLSHGAGVADIEFPDYVPDDPLPTLLQILNGTPPAKNKPLVIDAIPGSRFSYSRGGYDWPASITFSADDNYFCRS